jgi:regulator of replication initiation timing
MFSSVLMASCESPVKSETEEIKDQIINVLEETEKLGISMDSLKNKMDSTKAKQMEYKYEPKNSVEKSNHLLKKN